MTGQVEPSEAVPMQEAQLDQQVYSGDFLEDRQDCQIDGSVAEIVEH